MKLWVSRKGFLVLAAVVVVAIATGLAVVPKNTPSNDVVTKSVDTPDESKPGKDYQWQGSPQDPKKIIIPKIGVDSYIQKVGVDQNKQVAVPNNLFVVGWFVGSAKPGDKGLSVIDGHVTGRKNDGVFKNLDKLNAGDEYSIEYGDGLVKKFRVINKQSVPEQQSVGVIFSQDPKVSNQVNLVTCSGIFDETSRSYSERLTVESELLP